jgi:hypothetical protein
MLTLCHQPNRTRGLSPYFECDILSILNPNTTTKLSFDNFRSTDGRTEIESPLENITIDYHTLDLNHMHNQNITSEVAGNVTDGIRDDYYAVATLDGTILIAKDNEIQW